MSLSMSSGDQFAGLIGPGFEQSLVPPGEESNASSNPSSAKPISDVLWQRLFEVPLDPNVFQGAASPTAVEADIALIKEAMTGMQYGYALEKLCDDLDFAVTYWEDDLIQIHPFYYLYDPFDSEVKGNCIELSHYLMHRLDRINNQNAFSEPFKYSMVVGQCPGYGVNPGTEHIYIVGCVASEYEKVKATLLKMMGGSVQDETDFLIIDPTFGIVAPFQKTEGYVVNKFVPNYNNGAALPTYRNDCSHLRFSDTPGGYSTRMIPLGFAKTLLDPSEYPHGFHDFSLMQLSFKRDISPAGHIITPILHYKHGPDEPMLRWGNYPEFLAALPEDNYFRRFMSRVWNVIPGGSEEK